MGGQARALRCCRAAHAGAQAAAARACAPISTPHHRSCSAQFDFLWWPLHLLGVSRHGWSSSSAAVLPRCACRRASRCGTRMRPHLDPALRCACSAQFDFLWWPLHSLGVSRHGWSSSSAAVLPRCACRRASRCGTRMRPISDTALPRRPCFAELSSWWPLHSLGVSRHGWSSSSAAVLPRCACRRASRCGTRMRPISTTAPPPRLCRALFVVALPREVAADMDGQVRALRCCRAAHAGAQAAAARACAPSRHRTFLLRLRSLHSWWPLHSLCGSRHGWSSSSAAVLPRCACRRASRCGTRMRPISTPHFPRPCFAELSSWWRSLAMWQQTWMVKFERCGAAALRMPARKPLRHAHAPHLDPHLRSCVCAVCIRGGATRYVAADMDGQVRALRCCRAAHAGAQAAAARACAPSRPRTSALRLRSFDFVVALTRYVAADMDGQVRALRCCRAAHAGAQAAAARACAPSRPRTRRPCFADLSSWWPLPCEVAADMDGQVRALRCCRAAHAGAQAAAARACAPSRHRTLAHALHSLLRWRSLARCQQTWMVKFERCGAAALRMPARKPLRHAHAPPSPHRTAALALHSLTWVAAPLARCQQTWVVKLERCGAAALRMPARKPLRHAHAPPSPHRTNALSVQFDFGWRSTREVSADMGGQARALRCCRAAHAGAQAAAARACAPSPHRTNALALHSLIGGRSTREVSADMGGQARALRCCRAAHAGAQAAAARACAPISDTAPTLLLCTVCSVAAPLARCQQTWVVKLERCGAAALRMPARKPLRHAHAPPSPHRTNALLCTV